MKRIAALLVLLSACSHARHVAKQEGDAQDQPASGQSAQAPQPKHSEGGPSAKARAARRPERPGAPPLAPSPGALFVPGGIEQIQQALESRGYLSSEAKKGDLDEATSAAIRKFQSDQGIARTGAPDHETVRRLGLDAEKLFRKSADVKDAHGNPP